MRKYSVGVFLNVFDKNIDNWKEQMAWIEKLGNVEHIEILIEDVSLNNKEKLILKNLLKKYRIIIHAPFMDLTLLSPHPEITESVIKIFKRAIAIGSYLNAEVMTMHAQGYPMFWKENQAYRKTNEAVRLLVKNTRFPLTIENMSSRNNVQINFPSSPESIEKLSKTLCPNAGITIDVGHLIESEFDPLEIIQKINSNIYNIHLHDGKKNKAHLCLGDGNLDLKKLLYILQEKNYDKFLTIEVVGKSEIENSWKTLLKSLKET